MNNIKVLAIIQARMSSSRLPKKILLKIKKKSILETIYKNLFLTQDYDHDQLIQYTSEWFGGNVDVLNMVLDNTKEKQLSLSWHLTESEKKTTYNSILSSQNQKAIQRLKQLIN